ncbi:MAG TPA: HU family DNA-binding protein [Paraburkholderia sp.]
MNRQELVDTVATAKSESATATGEAIDAVTTAATGRETVELIGFGLFASGERAADVGRNAATGEAIEISVATLVRFTVGKVFREAVSAS